jgi:type I restriction enzyme R subunit
VVKRYQNRAIETAQVIEELIEMAKKFREAVNRIPLHTTRNT